MEWRIMLDTNYEVDDPMIKSILLRVGRKLLQDMPPKYGFTLFIFTYGEGGDLFYMSSALREDMIKTMKEFLRKQGETEL